MTSPSSPPSSSHLRAKFNAIKSRLVAISTDHGSDQKLFTENVERKPSVKNVTKKAELIKTRPATTSIKQSIFLNDPSSIIINRDKKTSPNKASSLMKASSASLKTTTPSSKAQSSFITKIGQIESSSNPCNSTIFSTPNVSKKSVSKNTSSKRSSSTINNVVESVIKSIKRARDSMGEAPSQSTRTGALVSKTTADDRKMLIAVSQRARENLAVKRILSSTILPSKTPLSPEKNKNLLSSSSSTSSLFSSLTTPVKSSGLSKTAPTNNSTLKTNTANKLLASSTASLMPPPSMTDKQIKQNKYKSTSSMIASVPSQPPGTPSDDGRVGRSLLKSTRSTPLRSFSASSVRSANEISRNTPKNPNPLRTPISKPRPSSSPLTTSNSSYKSGTFNNSTASINESVTVAKNNLSSTGEIFSSMKTDIEEYISPKKVADNPFAQLMSKR